MSIRIIPPPLSSAKFYIYKIADVDAYGDYTTTPDFSGFSVNIHGHDDEAWKTLASTLEGYVRKDSLTPADKGLTDKNGELSFPTGSGKLGTGLYLVLGDRHVQGGIIYDASPFIVMLPTSTDSGWDYAQTVDPKFNSRPAPPTPVETITRKVLKIWQDSGYESKRPQSVTVHLLQDGKVWDTVTLNERNNWRYTWTGLPAANTWSIVEDVPQDYIVQITREGITYVVENFHTEDVPDEPPIESDTPDPTDDPDEPPQDVDIPPEDTPDSPDDSEELPQTGQLWWPVPILLCSGLFLLLIGMVRRKGDTNEEN